MKNIINNKALISKILIVSVIMAVLVNIVIKTKANEQEKSSQDISIEEIQKIYVSNCSLCHGTEGKGMKVINPNIPDFTDASWQSSKRDEELFLAIEKGKGEGKRSMPRWEAILSTAKIKGLVNYIRTFSSNVNTSSESAENLYLRYCSSCHSKSGVGKRKYRSIPNFRRLSWQKSKSDEQLYSSISNGFDRKPSLNHRWKFILDDKQIKSLITYVRDFPNK